jgi:hypothetical protein
VNYKRKAVANRAITYLAVLFRILLILVIPILIGSVGYVIYTRFFVRRPLQIGVYLTDATKIDQNPEHIDPFSENKCEWPLSTESIMTDPHIRVKTPFEMRFINSPAAIQIRNDETFPLAVRIKSLVKMELQAYSNGGLIPAVHEFQIGLLDIPIEAKSVKIQYDDPLPNYYLDVCSPEISYSPNLWEVDFGWTSNLLQLVAGFDLDPQAKPITLAFQDVQKIKIDDQEINSLDKLEMVIERIEPRNNDAIFGDYTLDLVAIDFSGLLRLSPGDDLFFRIKNPNTEILWISGESQQFAVSQPRGWYEIGGEKTEFGFAAETLFIEAQVPSKNLSLYQPSIGDEDYIVSIEGTSKNVQLDGIQLVKSAWEKLDPGVQNAYIVFALSTLFGFLSLAFRSRKTLLEFVKEPGNFVKTDGFLRKLYILTDVREYKDGHWGVPKRGEMRIPINQVEMEYYHND